MTRTKRARDVARGTFPWRSVGAVMLGLTVGLGACDTEELVDLTDPDLITLPTVQDTANIESLRNGAVSEFASAMAGPAANNATAGIVGISAVFTDEAWYASTFPTMKDVDRRVIFDTNGQIQTVYHNLHRARNLAEETAAIYADSRPSSPDRAMLINLAAFTYVLFAENWCSGVPFSRAPLGQPLEYSPGISKTEMLNQAIARFDEAMSLAQSAGADAELNAARVGKARALQNLGQFDNAATAVSGVPDDFVYEVTYSENSAGQNNGVWYNFNSEVRSSVATAEGQNGLVFFPRGETPDAMNSSDPRVVADSFGVGLGTSVPHYGQLEYPDRGANIVLASGVEARLIEAEALLASDANAAFGILSDLRADVGLGALTPSGDANADLLTLYEERAFWMWLSAHRQGDLRRLVAQYGFGSSEVYPVGLTIFGVPYGDDVVFPVPEEERNNPEWEGCIDFEA